MAVLECFAAFARLRREQHLDPDREERARRRAALICTAAHREVAPTAALRERAGELLRLYPLRAGDALQLASALVWVDGPPAGEGFVCFDQRLRGAAAVEGFEVLPPELPPLATEPPPPSAETP